MKLDINAIKQKLANLKRLRDNPGATEGEANAAEAAINRTLLAYNLAEYEIPDDLDEPTEAETFVRDAHIVAPEGKSDAIKWRSILIGCLARHYFCRTVTHSGYAPGKWRQSRKNVVTIVGKPSNIAVLKEVFNGIADTIEKESLKAWATYDGGVHKRTFLRSFRLGATIQVNKRLEAQRRKDLEGDERANALVVVANDDVEGALNDFFPNLGKPRKVNDRLSHAGYYSGQAAGSAVKIQESLGSARRALNAGRLSLNA